MTEKKSSVMLVWRGQITENTGISERVGTILRWMGLLSLEDMAERGLYQRLAVCAGRPQSRDQALLLVPSNGTGGMGRS